MKLNKTLEMVVDPYVGIVKRIHQVPLLSSEPILHFCAAHWQNTAHLSPHSRDKVGLAHVTDHQSAGAGHSLESTLWSTVGEALERYAASIIDPDRLVLASFCDMDKRAVHPKEFILFSEESYRTSGFPFRKLDEKTQVFWTAAIEYPGGDEVYLPTEFVWPGAIFEGRKPIDNGYSTGSAAGQTILDAAFSAVREVVERDAYMCYLQTGTAPLKIPMADVVKSVSHQTASLLDEEDIEFTFLDVTTDLGIPCILTNMTSKHHENKGIASGLSAHPVASLALEKSVMECFHTYNWLIDLNRWPEMPRQDVESFMNHVQFHIGEGRLEHLAFLFDNNEVSDILNRACKVDSTFSSLVKCIDECGYRTYLVDLTTEDIERLNVYVAKAVIPGLHPIYAGNGNQHTDTRRLKKFLDWKGVQADDFKVNYILHPFP